VADLTAFLREVDLTLSGLDEPDVRLWIERDAEGRIVGSTGYELNADGDAVLVRSVAVHPRQRAAGRGTALARFALSQARVEGRRVRGCSAADRAGSGRRSASRPQTATNSPRCSPRPTRYGCSRERSAEHRGGLVDALA
jgi:GNAT superfamily N-acetyltransferase